MWIWENSSMACWTLVYTLLVNCTVAIWWLKIQVVFNKCELCIESLVGCSFFKEKKPTFIFCNTMKICLPSLRESECSDKFVWALRQTTALPSRQLLSLPFSYPLLYMSHYVSMHYALCNMHYVERYLAAKLSDPGTDAKNVKIC